jgi:hypothetical protein
MNGKASAQGCGSYTAYGSVRCLDYQNRSVSHSACNPHTAAIGSRPARPTASCPNTCCTETHTVDGVVQSSVQKVAGTCNSTSVTTPPPPPEPDPIVTAQRECRHVQTYANEIGRWNQTSSSCGEAISALEARCNSERGEATSAGSVSNQLTLSGGSCVVQYNCPRRWRIEYQECRSVYSDGTTGNWGRGDAGGQTRVGWSRGSTQGYYY